MVGDLEHTNFFFIIVEMTKQMKTMKRYFDSHLGRLEQMPIHNCQTTLKMICDDTHMANPFNDEELKCIILDTPRQINIVVIKKVQ